MGNGFFGLTGLQRMGPLPVVELDGDFCASQGECTPQLPGGRVSEVEHTHIRAVADELVGHLYGQIQVCLRARTWKKRATIPGYQVVTLTGLVAYRHITLRQETF